jgi:hypothetical protein
MPRDPEDEFEPEGPEFVEWEANHDLVKKLLNVLKFLVVHEALLTMVAACDQLMKNAPKDWDSAKVKQVLTDL